MESKNKGEEERRQESNYQCMNLPLILISTLPQRGKQVRSRTLAGTIVLGSREATAPIGEIVAIPARIYPPVRLCFVPSQLATDDGLREKNSRSSRRFNCVITEDGRIQSVVVLIFR